MPNTTSTKEQLQRAFLTALSNTVDTILDGELNTDREATVDVTPISNAIVHQICLLLETNTHKAGYHLIPDNGEVHLEVQSLTPGLKGLFEAING